MIVLLRYGLIGAAFVGGMLAGAYAAAVVREGHAQTVPELIDHYAAIHHVPAGTARSIAWCESRFVASARNRSSGAAGVFQFMPRTWAWASAQAGWGGASVWNAEANVAVALWLMAAGQSQHWRACW